MAYGVVLIGMFAFQRDLMYFPDTTPLQPPAVYGLENTRAVTLETEDKLALNAWYTPPQEGLPLMVYFHGNAGNLSYRIEKMKAFTQNGMGLLALEYRGYGGNPGQPSERGLYEDAVATLQYALYTLKLPASRIILYGESLGTGVAVQMATSVKVGVVVLEAPYTSAVDRAQELYPWIPVSVLMLDRFESIKKIQNIQAPLLIFHNTQDPVIPVTHGHALYAAAKAPKHAFWFPRTGHSHFDWKRLEEEMRESYQPVESKTK